MKRQDFHPQDVSCDASTTT